jgi:hypothetical protein
MLYIHDNIKMNIDKYLFRAIALKHRNLSARSGEYYDISPSGFNGGVVNSVDPSFACGCCDGVVNSVGLAFGVGTRQSGGGDSHCG